MTRIRHSRRPIAVLLALFMLAGAGLADAALAASGPQIQIPLCTPVGADHPIESPERVNLSDHCDFCPLGTGFAGLAPQPFDRGVPTDRAMAGAGAEYRPFLTVRRVELIPLEGRAPPHRS